MQRRCMPMGSIRALGQAREQAGVFSGFLLLSECLQGLVQLHHIEVGRVERDLPAGFVEVHAIRQAGVAGTVRAGVYENFSHLCHP